MSNDKQQARKAYDEKLEHLEKRVDHFEQGAITEIKELRRKFDRKFHALYLLVTFIGIALVWYGLWTIISEIAIINNPYVACGLGFVILLLSGRLFDRLV